jgi:hypothetical protein
MVRRVPPARILLVLVALLASSACAHPLAPPFSSGRKAEAAGARIRVKNPHWEDLTVYLDRQGTPFRLGVVPGNESRTLEIPDVYVRVNCWARLVAMTAGREQHAASEVFGLAPGDYAVWEIGLIGRTTPVHFTDPPTG